MKRVIEIFVIVAVLAFVCAAEEQEEELKKKICIYESGSQHVEVVRMWWEYVRRIGMEPVVYGSTPEKMRDGESQYFRHVYDTFAGASSHFDNLLRPGWEKDTNEENREKQVGNDHSDTEKLFDAFIFTSVMWFDRMIEYLQMAVHTGVPVILTMHRTPHYMFQRHPEDVSHAAEIVKKPNVYIGAFEGEPCRQWKEWVATQSIARNVVLCFVPAYSEGIDVDVAPESLSKRDNIVVGGRICNYQRNYREMFRLATALDLTPKLVGYGRGEIELRGSEEYDKSVKWVISPPEDEYYDEIASSKFLCLALGHSYDRFSGRITGSLPAALSVGVPVVISTEEEFRMWQEFGFEQLMVLADTEEKLNALKDMSLDEYTELVEQVIELRDYVVEESARKLGELLDSVWDGRGRSLLWNSVIE